MSKLKKAVIFKFKYVYCPYCEYRNTKFKFNFYDDYNNVIRKCENKHCNESFIIMD